MARCARDGGRKRGEPLPLHARRRVHERMAHGVPACPVLPRQAGRLLPGLWKRLLPELGEAGRRAGEHRGAAPRVRRPRRAEIPGPHPRAAQHDAGAVLPARGQDLGGPQRREQADLRVAHVPERPGNRAVLLLLSDAGPARGGGGGPGGFARRDVLLQRPRHAADDDGRDDAAEGGRQGRERDPRHVRLDRRRRPRGRRIRLRGAPLHERPHGGGADGRLRLAQPEVAGNPAARVVPRDGGGARAGRRLRGGPRRRVVGRAARRRHRAQDGRGDGHAALRLRAAQHGAARPGGRGPSEPRLRAAARLRGGRHARRRTAALGAGACAARGGGGQDAARQARHGPCHARRGPGGRHAAARRGRRAAPRRSRAGAEPRSVRLGDGGGGVPGRGLRDVSRDGPHGGLFVHPAWAGGAWVARRRAGQVQRPIG